MHHSSLWLQFAVDACTLGWYVASAFCC